uniref:Predicted protein n=1 Tax=Physcomitrium patens TaxID=3218 RepID=A9U453_PHYPA
MVIESTKRAINKDDSGQNVRAKYASKPLSVIMITNMEPMKLDIDWTSRRKRDFQNMQLFQFLQQFDCLPPINMALVEEYIINYDTKDGSNVVQRRIIKIDEIILEKVLFLFIGEITVEADESSDFSPGRFFKGDMSSIERSQGILEEMVFNWIAYVTTHIDAEIGAKWKLGKFTYLLSSNYVSAVIMYTLCQTPPVKESPMPMLMPLQRERNWVA